MTTNDDRWWSPRGLEEAINKRSAAYHGTAPEPFLISDGYLNADWSTDTDGHRKSSRIGPFCNDAMQ